MVISVIIGVMGMPLIGIFSDRYSPTITLPASFFTRFIAMFMFMFVTDPNTFYSYFCSIFMIFGTAFEGIVAVSMNFRMADPEIRGVMSGIMSGIGYGGQLVFCLIGGFLFDYMSSYAPFAFVGLLDLSMTIGLIWAAKKGYLTDDHAERRL